MKTILLGLLMIGLACSARALDRAQLDDRVRSLTARFTAMQMDPATRVPANDLARAQGIILLDQTRGAFVFGFHSGNGVAMARGTSGHWGPAGFVSSVGASLGAQIGGSRDFFVILLMTPGSAQSLGRSTIDLGAQASGTGGARYAGTQANLTSSPSVIVYSQRNGLYAGATIRGGSISPDRNANAVYYGRPISMDEILFESQVVPGAAYYDLIAKIEQFSR